MAFVWKVQCDIFYFALQQIELLPEVEYDTNFKPVSYRAAAPVRYGAPSDKPEMHESVNAKDEVSVDLNSNINLH